VSAASTARETLFFFLGAADEGKRARMVVLIASEEIGTQQAEVAVNLFNRAQARMRSAPQAITGSIERSLTECETLAAGAGGGAGMSEGLECGTSDSTGWEWRLN
jgi:hypothetical protein